ncbi:MAG: AAA family ATPase [Candidatus Micrarchaeota archaeon]
MKLLSLELKNIRSYAQARIEFASGVTLFEGDIGCGKSTLLYAIEFALFGLGDLNSEYLLKHGTPAGAVKLRMRILEREYVFERTLERKRDSVQQGIASITADGKRVEYAPREMRAAVLKILGFNEPPSPKATSWIYRYAVFTPQEEMKLVLSLSDEERMNTLRKAFGIEDYRTARDNAAIVARELKALEQRVEGETDDLPDIQIEKAEKEAKLSEAKTKLAGLNDKARAIEAKLAEAKALLASLREQAKSVEGTAREIPLLEKHLREKRAEQTRTSGEAEKLRKQAVGDEIELSEVKKKILPSVKSEAQIKAELESVRKQAGSLAAECGSLSAKLLEYEELERKGVCPTCERPIAGADFASKKASLASQLNEKTKARDASEARQRSLEEALEEFREAQRAAKRAAEIEARLNDYRERESEARAKASALTAEIPALEKTLTAKRAELEASAGLRENLARSERVQSDADAELRAVMRERGAAEGEAAALEKRAVELAAKIEEKLAKRKQLEDLREKRAWLAECFVPALESIEQSVLAATQSDFDAALQSFFAILVEESGLSVRASEAFAPLVTQEGYEQSAGALSGGEKSALALAYRLALNKVVRSASPSLKENLLILDEPTDGFSKEQLGRMRDVLEAVGAEQVLLVSHERELEGFADNVYRIIKEAGASKIE